MNTEKRKKRTRQHSNIKGAHTLEELILYLLISFGKMEHKKRYEQGSNQKL
jgi:hypothetical protein